MYSVKIMEVVLADFVLLECNKSNFSSRMRNLCGIFEVKAKLEWFVYLRHHHLLAHVGFSVSRQPRDQY